MAIIWNHPAIILPIVSLYKTMQLNKEKQHIHKGQQILKTTHPICFYLILYKNIVTMLKLHLMCISHTLILEPPGGISFLLPHMVAKGNSDIS